MRLCRMLAIGAATALVGVSTLVVGASASAADTYVADIQTSPSWTITGAGTATDSPTGLHLVGGMPRIAIQSAVTANDLSDFEDSLGGTMAGLAQFEIHLFTNGAAGTGATVLTAAALGTEGLNDNYIWTTRGQFESIAPFSMYTIAQFEAELARAGVTPEITAYGLSVPMPHSATVYSIQLGDDATWFLPAGIAATASPASITVADATNPAKGVTGVFTGFVPNESVTIGVGNGGSGGDLLTTTADAGGSVTYRYVADATFSSVGSYTLSARSDVSGSTGFASFGIIANPAQLAATGADFTPAVVAGGVLMLLGAGFVLAGRRRAAAHRS